MSALPSAETLLAGARAETGITLIDTAALEPLTVLLQSFNEESNLSAAGATAMQRYLLRLLGNRLRMQRDLQAHPEILEQNITAPLFLWGMPRTGSTKMQKLAAASGDFNWLSFWQSQNPASLTGEPNEDVAARIADTEAFAQWFAEAGPDTKFTHPLRTHEPEEETFILMHSLRTPVFMAFADVTGYLHWLAATDMSAQFFYLRDTLKYLQWQGLADPNKPWVLKSPLSYGLEPAVLAAFPDAHLAMTHRDPLEAMPSFLSTIKSYYKPFSDAPINYDTKLGQLIWGLNQHLAYRQANPGFAVLDIGYRELDADASLAMRRVYAHLGKPLTDSAAAAMRGWERDHPKHAQGGHR
jgi:hypothetical protein